MKICLWVEVMCPHLAMVARTPQTQKACLMSRATVLLRLQSCTVTTVIILSTPATITRHLPLHTTGVGADTVLATPKTGKWKERMEATQPSHLLPSRQLPVRPQHPPPPLGRLFGLLTGRGELCALSVVSTAVCFSWTMSCLPFTWAATVFTSLLSVTSVATAARTVMNFLHTLSAGSTSLTEVKG